MPGQELFQYVDDDGCTRDVGSADVNAYVKEVSGDDFTAKDFRTWAGTVLACAALRGMDFSENRAAKEVVRAIDAVAGVLGNTRAVCRKSYVHPAIIDAYVSGTMKEMFGGRGSAARGRGGLSGDECAALALLRALPKQPRARAA